MRNESNHLDFRTFVANADGRRCAMPESLSTRSQYRLHANIVKMLEDFFAYIFSETKWMWTNLDYEHGKNMGNSDPLQRTRANVRV